MEYLSLYKIEDGYSTKYMIPFKTEGPTIYCYQSSTYNTSWDISGYSIHSHFKSSIGNAYSLNNVENKEGLIKLIFLGEVV